MAIERAAFVFDDTKLPSKYSNLSGERQSSLMEQARQSNCNIQEQLSYTSTLSNATNFGLDFIFNR